MENESPPFAAAVCRPRHDGWTPDRQRAFIEHLAVNGNVKRASFSVAMTPASAYRLRQHSTGRAFAAAWDAALVAAIARLTDAAIERAIYGQQQEVYHLGSMVGTRTVYDNRLLMFMLANRGNLMNNRIYQAASTTRTMPPTICKAPTTSSPRRSSRSTRRSLRPPLRVTSIYFQTA